MGKVGKYIVKGIMRALGAMPLKAHYACSGFLAWLIRDVVKYRSTDVAINLTRAFPDKDYGELIQLHKDFYRHFADLIVEAIWFGGCRNAKRLRDQRICEIANPEVIRHLIDVAPNTMVLYSHTGNWELLGGIGNYNYSDIDTGLSEQNFCVVYRAQSKGGMWDEILKENRFAPLLDREHFEGYLESQEVIKYAFTHRHDKKVYNMNTDQRPYFSSPANMIHTFMHQKSHSMTGGAAIASKFGMSVAYLNMWPDRRGHYLLEYSPICEDASKMTPEEIMTRYYELLEKDINAHPANYLWTHRRWYKF